MVKNFDKCSDKELYVMDMYVMDTKPMDIVDRLRLRNNATDDIAIAEIERLRAENAELREKVIKLQHWIDLEHEED